METLCDRVCILRRGEVVVAGVLRELLDTGTKWSEVTLTGVTAALREDVLAMGVTAHDMAGAWIVDIEGEAKTRELIQKALAAGASIDALIPKRETLEAIFVRKAL